MPNRRLIGLEVFLVDDADPRHLGHMAAKSWGGEGSLAFVVS